MQGAVLVVPKCEEHDDVLRVELALLKRVVEQSEHGGGRGFLLGGGAHDSADERGEEGSGGGFAADVAEHDGGLVVGVFEEVVEVAADSAGGKKADRELGVLVRWGRGGEKAKLDFAGHGDVALELLLLPPDALVETRVFDGDGDLRGHGGEGADVIFVEEGSARVFEIEYADDSFFVEERDDEFGARFGVHGEIALIFADVGNVDGTPLADGCADEAGGDGDAAQGRLRIAEAPGVAGDERLAFVVEKHDGEHLVIDEAAEEIADLGEERIEIEDGDDLGGDFVEDGEGFGLAGDAGVEAGVFDGLGDAGAGEGEQMEVLGLEEAGLFAFKVEDADEAVFGNERDGEFGADVGIGVDVAFDLR